MTSDTISLLLRPQTSAHLLFASYLVTCMYLWCLVSCTSVFYTGGCTYSTCGLPVAAAPIQLVLDMVVCPWLDKHQDVKLMTCAATVLASFKTGLLFIEDYLTYHALTCCVNSGQTHASLMT